MLRLRREQSCLAPSPPLQVSLKRPNSGRTPPFHEHTSDLTMASDSCPIVREAEARSVPKCDAPTHILHRASGRRLDDCE
jgi:hypothetical protein